MRLPWSQISLASRCQLRPHILSCAYPLYTDSKCEAGLKSAVTSVKKASNCPASHSKYQLVPVLRKPLAAQPHIVSCVCPLCMYCKCEAGLNSTWFVQLAKLIIYTVHILVVTLVPTGLTLASGFKLSISFCKL